MKKSLFLALVFAAACGYAVAEEEATTTPVETPATEEVTPTPAPAQEESAQEDTLDMDELLADETEEVK